MADPDLEAMDRDADGDMLIEPVVDEHALSERVILGVGLLRDDLE